MGRGGYNGGSTIIGPNSLGWFSRPKPKAEMLRDAAEAELERESILKQRASKKSRRVRQAKGPKLTGEERALEREARAKAKQAIGSIVVEVRQGRKIVRRKLGLNIESDE